MKPHRLIVSSRIAELAILAGVVKAEEVQVMDRNLATAMDINDVTPASARRNGPPNRAERRAAAAMVRRGRVFNP